MTKGYYIEAFGLKIELGKYLDGVEEGHIKTAIGWFNFIKVTFIDTRINFIVYDEEDKKTKLEVYLCHNDSGYWLQYPQSFEGILPEPK